MDMLKKLQETEKMLSSLLRDKSKWHSLLIDYESPKVERLWLEYGDHRVYLHQIMPCKQEEALFHPHPWPSSMKILSGKYEMGIGYCSGKTAPPLAAKITMHEGSSYEMSNIGGWHYVAPIGEPVFSLMITGKPWDRWSPMPTNRLGKLSEKQEIKLFKFFEEYYASLGGKK